MFKKKILKNKQLFFVLIIYVINYIFFYNNFINSLFWLIFLIIFYRHDFSLLKKKEIKITLIIAIFFFIIYLVNGLLFGFSKYSYNYKLIDIFINLGNIVLFAYGIEIFRFKLIKSNKDNIKSITLITFIFIIIEIIFTSQFLLHNNLFYYLISGVVPIIAQNMLYTYLSLNSNYYGPIIFRLFTDVPKYLLPIILNSNWFVAGSCVIIKVLIIYYLFKYFIFSKKIINYNIKINRLLYPLTIMISIFLILFMLEFFPYKSIAILSNSMNPTFRRGDVVIYKRKEKIVPGDIIVFQYQNQIIVHRVVGINEYYVTKGDANNSIDYLKVLKKDIKGVYQCSFKYLGYPSIWLNELFTKEI